MNLNNGASNTQLPKVPLRFVIEEKQYETFDQYKSGAELKELAGIPLETELFLSISKPYADELIENDKSVNLARPETEYFFVKKKLLFTINGVQHTWYKQFIRGVQIRNLGNIPENENIYLNLPEGWQDDKIENDEIVDLARPGVEHFISRKNNLEIDLIIEGNPIKYNKPKITYKEVVEFGLGQFDPNRGYTVKYTNGPEQNQKGVMAVGTEVFVKDKMRFNVASCHKS